MVSYNQFKISFELSFVRHNVIALESINNVLDSTHNNRHHRQPSNYYMEMIALKNYKIWLMFYYL